MSDDATDWIAPWLRNWPEKPTAPDDMVEYVMKHGTHHDVLACCIKVHSLGLAQADREKAYDAVGLGIDLLMHSDGNEVLNAFDENHKYAEHMFGGRSGGWVELVYPKVSHHGVKGYSRADAEDVEGLSALVDVVWDFDHAVEDAVRTTIAWMRPRVVRDGRIVIEDVTKCEACGGKGWFFFPYVEGVEQFTQCADCGQYKTSADALDAALNAARTPGVVRRTNTQLIEVAAMAAERWVDQGEAYSDFIKKLTLAMEAKVKK
jgi:hypothetical protein